MEGTSSVPKLNALTGETEDFYPSRYPYGTALTMALPVALAGWRGGYIVPCFSLLAGVLLFGYWLRQEGRSPLFALLLLGYPPALVMGRVAMSDVPSLFLVILGLWLFWRGTDRGWKWWLASGFVAGGFDAVSREQPDSLRSVLRRRRAPARAQRLGARRGRVAGLGLRVRRTRSFSASRCTTGPPYILALASLPERLPIYALALLVFVPGDSCSRSSTAGSGGRSSALRWRAS